MIRPKFELVVGGYQVGTWISASLSRVLGSLEVRGQFDMLDVAPRDPIPVERGEPVVVRIDGHRVFEGYVRNHQKPTDANTGRMSVTVASTSTDLVECSVARGSWRKATPRTIATELLEEYRLVPVTTDPAFDVPLKKFSVRPSEPVARALERLGEQLRLMVTPDGRDGVLFTRAGGENTTPIRTRLQQPGNVISGSLHLSDNQLFSPLIVRAQRRGGDRYYGDKIAGSHVTLTDPNVKRHRPLVVTTHQRNADLEAVAEWERARRYGLSQSLSHSVLGFSHADGPWEPNQVVQVVDASSRVTEQLLVTSVTYSMTEQTARTSLVLSRLESFLPEPPPKKKKGKGL